MTGVRLLRRVAGRLVGSVERGVGAGLAAVLPVGVRRSFVDWLCRRHPQVIVDALGRRLNREPDLEHMPFDLPVGGPLQFEHLAGLFASTPLDHAVISMTIRQAAYLFGLVRTMPARRVIEVGRYKGGSTLVIAAAMAGEGEFWSIDVGEKETRLRERGTVRPYDEQLRDVCRRFGLKVHLVVGDSRVVQVDTGEVDLVLIDGDHSYEGVRNDFERFGQRVRVGGAILFDDAVDDGLFTAHSDTVGRLVREVVSGGQFRLVTTVNRLAHVERTA